MGVRDSTSIRSSLRVDGTDEFRSLSASASVISCRRSTRELSRTVCSAVWTSACSVDTFKAEVGVDVTAGFAAALDGFEPGLLVSVEAWVVETLGWCHAVAAAFERDSESRCEGVVGVSDEALCRSVPCRQCVKLQNELPSDLSLLHRFGRKNECLQGHTELWTIQAWCKRKSERAVALL